DPADHERIFDDFYRIDTRLSSNRSGVGLGLTLVRRIAQAHGGRVTVQSAPGRGSTFTVWLPLETSESSGPLEPGGRLATGA
ncbi:MAG: ATP-binding protein, partial [Candidatus Krumholzibacteriia bacterium]